MNIDLWKICMKRKKDLIWTLISMRFIMKIDIIFFNYNIWFIVTVVGY